MPASESSVSSSREKRASTRSKHIVLSDLVDSGDEGAGTGQGHVHVSGIQDQREEGRAVDHRPFN